MQEVKNSSIKGFPEIPSAGTSPDFPKVLHALANKLLPIVAFSDLGIRNSEDKLSLNYFQKIRQAAGDARDLLVSLRRQLQEQERSRESEKQESRAENDSIVSTSMPLD